ncbi:PEGA domain-containing protein, partial [Chlamydiales bacterium]|nr:PEGA domain-containing protein [Chlamydiales bacterium]
SLTLLTSCATIMNGPNQSIRIGSNPQDALVYVDQYYMGQTPLVVQMTRSDNHFVRIELDGFCPYEATFSKKISAWIFGNIIFGGFIGLAVDTISGGIYVLTPDQIQAQMCSSYASQGHQSEDSYITFVLEPDPSWKKIGNLVAKD